MSALLKTIFAGIVIVFVFQGIVGNSAGVDAFMHGLNPGDSISLTDKLTDKISSQGSGKGVFNQSTTAMLKNGSGANASKWGF